MYRGNMREFVDQLSLYLKKTQNREIYLENSILIRMRKRKVEQVNALIVYEVGRNGDYGKEVYDREDFEKQIYDIVNENEREGLARNYEILKLRKI